MGLLPFYRYTDACTGERQLLLLGVGTTDYLDGVFRPACPVEPIREALELVCAEDDWDVLYASQLLPGSRLLEAIAGAPAFEAQTYDSASGSVMPAVPLERLPQKIRRNAMYYRNRAARLGALELRIADASTWSCEFEELYRLHTARWQQAGEPGVLADPRVPAWHREALPLLERAGLLRLVSLKLNGETLGVLYSLIDPPFRRERTQYFYLTAYAPQHAELRPGTLLLAAAIDHAAREGVGTIDMLRGDEPYKRLWHLDRRATRGFALRRASLRRPFTMAA